MTGVVNLNRFRKKKARASKERRAEENRVKHGRTKAERDREAMKNDQARLLLDGHELESD